MRSFTDLGVFGAYLQAKVAEVHHAQQMGLHDAGDIIEHEAKARIGTYQGATGPFPAWAELADYTKAERERLGFTPNDPLLRTGEMRDSIGLTLTEDKVVVGSDSPIAADQEMGTPGARRPIPPRPFLGPAAFAKGHEAVDAIAQAVGRSIAGLPYKRVKPGDKADIPF